MRIEQIMNKLKSLFFLILFLVAGTSYSLQDSVLAIVNDKVILQYPPEIKKLEIKNNIDIIRKTFLRFAAPLILFMLII